MWIWSDKYDYQPGEIFPDKDGSTAPQADAGELTMNGVLCYHNNIGGNLR